MRNIARSLAVAILTSSFMASRALAQGAPMGTEFQVNTYTTFDQKNPRVAASPLGDFLVVWTSLGTSDAVGQRYSAAGARLGGEFLVHATTAGYQGFPDAAFDGTGKFVVIWTSDGQDGSGLGVFGQRYASSGAPVGPEFRVNSFTTGAQSNGSVGRGVAADAAGNFVVVWESRGQDGSGKGIFAQRYDSGGVPRGGEFRVNTYTTNYQYHASVGSDAAGNFVVVWQSHYQGAATDDVFGQRFTSSGTQLGMEFKVNSTPDVSNPAMSMAPSGAFVVVWDGNDVSDLGVFGRRFASSGAALGSDFQVSTITNYNQYSAGVATDAAGNFVVAWVNNVYDKDIFGQRFSSTGPRLGNEFQVNTYTTDQQTYPSVASDAAGNFVVVWQSVQVGGNSGYDIFGQRYGQILPVELIRFTAE